MATPSINVGGDRTLWTATELNLLRDGVAELQGIASGGSLSFLGAFNVKDLAYGAKGDGSTDDTTAIQAALTAAAAVGGAVYVPPGDYLISSTLTVASKVVFAGAGAKSRIFTTTNKLPLIRAISTTDTVIRDMWVEGNGTGSQPTNTADSPGSDAVSGSGIVFAGVTRGRVDNVTVYNCGGLATDSDHNGVAGIWLTYGCLYCVVKDCTALTCRNGINEDNFFNASPYGCKIVNNHVDGCEFGIAIDHGSNGQATLVDGNTVKNCVQSGIDVHSSPYTTVSNNHVNANGATLTNNGIVVYASSDGSIRAQRIKVIGNTCQANGTSGIKFSDYIQQSIIANNICVSNFRHGIYLNNNCTDIDVSGNVCLNNSLAVAGSFDGIRGDTSCTNIVVNGNRCFDTAGASGSQGYGLQTTASCDSWTIGPNDFTGNKTGAILLVGSSNSFRMKGTGSGLHAAASGEGMSGETTPRGNCGTSFAFTAGGQRGVLVGLPVGIPITHLVVHATVAASSVTLAKVGIWDTSGTLVASSADASASFNSVTGPIRVALSATFTPTSDTSDVAYYFVGLAMVGGTPSSLLASSTGVTGFTPSSPNSGVAAAVANTGKTDIGALTITASGTFPWVGWDAS